MVSNEITSNVISFVFGALSLLIALTLKDWFARIADRRKKRNARQANSIDYAKKMYHFIEQLKFRLEYLRNRNEDGDMNVIPDRTTSIEWYTKNGYFITSTVYLFAAVSCLTNRFRRNPDFVEFGKYSEYEELRLRTERYNQCISTNTIMWYHYHIAIGDSVFKDDSVISFYRFINKLSNDREYFAFINQAFQFTSQLYTDVVLLDSLTINLDGILSHIRQRILNSEDI